MKILFLRKVSQTSGHSWDIEVLITIRKFCSEVKCDQSKTQKDYKLIEKLEELLSKVGAFEVDSKVCRGPWFNIDRSRRDTGNGRR